MAEIDLISKYFNNSAESFDSLYSEKKSTYFMRSINRIFRKDIYERYILTMKHVDIYRPASVLDIGCGSGQYFPGFAERGVNNIIGIDISSKMVALATAKAACVRNTSVSFVNGDFMQFQSKEKLDVIVAMGVFDYIKYSAQALQKIKAFSRHSAIVSFPSVSFYRTPIRKFRYYFKHCPVYFYSKEQLDSICSQAEFRKYTINKISGAGMDYVVSLFI